MCLILPQRCQGYPSVMDLVSRLLKGDSPIEKVVYVSLDQSMRNGGGPACLRLRLVLNDKESSCIDSRILFTESRYERLVQVVEETYLESLTVHDLKDPEVLAQIQVGYKAVSLFG